MAYPTIFETDSVLRTDLLTEELLKDPRKIQVIAESQYKLIVRNANTLDRSQTPGVAKTIYETADLIRQAIEDYEKRMGLVQDARVKVSWQNPDTDAELEAITFGIERREPGQFSRGAPFEGDVKNMKGIFRAEYDDTENPGYKKAVIGYYHDNILRMTCWGRTNKSVNERALWLEDIMDEYMWWFRWSGVARILFLRQSGEVTREINNNRFYGRQLDYFVRTEKLKTISQREIESIIIRTARTGTGSTGPLEGGLP